MKPLGRILMIALLAIFAVGSAVHAMSATSMAVGMTLADAGEQPMSGCDGCGIDGLDDAAASCDLECVASSAALVHADHAVQATIGKDRLDNRTHLFVGRTGPPATDPPRTFILS